MTSKSLKRARHKLQKQAAEIAATPALSKNKARRKDWAKVISEALVSCKWEQALKSLRSMREAGQIPKLGAVQRWVRMADLSGKDEVAALLLDSIMRTAAGAASQNSLPESGNAKPTDRNTEDSTSRSTKFEHGGLEGSIRRHSAWCPPEPQAVSPRNIEEEVLAAQAAVARFEGHVHIVGTDVAPKMATSNPIFMTDPGVIHFDSEYQLQGQTGIEQGQGARPVARVEVPFVAGAFVLTGVLSRSEVAQIVAVSERMGYAFDADYSFASSGSEFPGLSSEPQHRVEGVSDISTNGNGVMSRNQSAARASIGGEKAAGCVWLADENLQAPIWERVRAHLPQSLGGGVIAGINARWRLYRYDQGTVYRPHVDGAWPGSGLKEGQVVFDAFGDRWSRLTFLMYLNDDFEGGSTTFYTPGDNEGVLEARGVCPRAGNILVFPHGDTAGSLVHEGSAVTKGSKYVIRTDVLYMLPPKVARSNSKKE